MRRGFHATPHGALSSRHSNCWLHENSRQTSATFSKNWLSKKICEDRPSLHWATMQGAVPVMCAGFDWTRCSTSPKNLATSPGSQAICLGYRSKMGHLALYTLKRNRTVSFL